MVCTQCGQVNSDNAKVCSHCGANLETQSQPVETPTLNTTTQPPVEKPENTVGGVIGAVIGALLGVIAIILIGQAGYVSALGGLALAFCSLKGYELLGGKLSMKGILICIAVMLVAPYFAHRLDFAIAVSQANPEYITFAEAFRYYHELINEAVAVGSLAEGDYMKEILMLYGFTAIGAVSVVASKIRNRNGNANAKK